MSVAIEIAALAERIDEFGEVAYLVSVGPEALSHVVSVRTRWEDDELVVGAGRQTMTNVSVRPDVALLWPASPGAPYALIVDGTARVRVEPTGAEATLAIAPTAAVLHRTPEGDPAEPSCIRVLERS